MKTLDQLLSTFPYSLNFESPLCLDDNIYGLLQYAVYLNKPNSFRVILEQGASFYGGDDMPAMISASISQLTLEPEAEIWSIFFDHGGSKEILEEAMSVGKGERIEELDEEVREELDARLEHII